MRPFELAGQIDYPYLSTLMTDQIKEMRGLELLVGRFLGENVISNQFKEPRKQAVVFDLDGTLVDTMRWEKHHKHRHEGFAKEAENADAIKKNVNKLREKHEDNHVVILTARSAHYRKETEDWLAKNDIPYDQLVMRPEHDDQTKDSTLKAHLLETKILPRFDVVKAYDDKGKNVKMFKEHNIPAKKV